MSKLINVCSVGDGAHAKIKRQSEGVLYLTAKNFTKNGLSLDKVEFITREDYAKHFLKDGKSITRVKKNDVVFSIIGSIGTPYVVKCDDEFALSSSVAILRPDESIIKAQFLFYWMTSETFQQYLFNIKSGAAQGFISLEMIKKLPVIIPSLTTQTKIANILSTYDYLIQNNRGRIKILEKSAQELYKEWFLRFRFPNYKNIKFEKGMPVGWEIKNLANMGKIETGKTPSKNKEDYYGNEYMFIKTPDMHDNIYVISTKEYISRIGSESQIKKKLPKNSILVSCIGTAGIVALNSREAHFNQQINTIIPNNSKHLEWLYFTCKSLKETIKLFGATGATMTNLSKRKFEKLKIIYPQNNIIEDFHEITKDIFVQVLNLQKQNKNLINQRNLLLSRLMSGKIEV